MNLFVNGEILLYGDVGDYWGDGSGFTVRMVAEALAEAPAGRVMVRINSGGGNAFDGVAIHSLLKSRGCVVAIDGLAASAASLIAMAGDEITMARGAMMMIHDASGITWGTAEDHAKQASTLDAISNNYAAIYAARSGKAVEEVRAIMKAETWFTADEAVTAGFASAVSAAEAAPVSAFDYDLYRAAPAALPRRVRPAQSAASAALSEEITMKVDPNTPAGVAPAVIPAPVASIEQPKAWAHDIYVAADKAGLTIAQTNEIVAKAETADAAKDGIIDAIAAKQSGALPNPNGGRTEVIADGGDKFRAGVSQALLAKGGVEARDPKNEWNGASLMAIATAVASRDGRLTSRDPSRIIQMAVGHSTADFPLILENVASKSMLKGYEESPETFEQWTSVGSLSDFKVAKRVDLNNFANLPLKPEGAEYIFMTTGERGEQVQLGTYGGMVSITREAIINDDIDAFSRIPRKLGVAARRSVGSAVYGVLTGNPAMSDAVALFHASHSNLLTGAGTALVATTAGIDALSAASAAMAKQKDRSATAANLNIRPAYLLVPVALEGIAKQIMNSTAEPGQTNAGVANRAAGMATVIADARLDAASLTAWYLAASQAFDTIEVSYLNGQRTPVIERDQPFMTDGVLFKVRHDFAAKALDWKTLHKSAGA